MPFDLTVPPRDDAAAYLPQTTQGGRKVKPKPVLVADLFCGAGGSSTGARRALARRGLTMDLVAVNHWETAVNTHSLNHPQARHYNVNLDAARPTDLVSEGRLDLLMASPECTHHSRARGGKPMNDQSRMSGWHVVRWCTELRTRRILLENVPEWMEWGPLNARTGRPIESRKGEYFQALMQGFRNIGFKLDYRVLDAANFGDATNRKRLFVIGRSDGKPLRWPDPTHSKEGGSDLLGHGAQKWRTARDIIDWSIPGQSIYNRKRPLSEKTLRRIAAGLRKYCDPRILQNVELKDGRPDLNPFVLMFYGTSTVKGIDQPLPTITAKGNHLALCEPFMVEMYGGSDVRSVDRPLSTVSTHGHQALCQPFLVPNFGERPGQTPRTHSIDAPLPAVTSHGAGMLVEPSLSPFIVPITHTGENRSRSIDSPLPTITTATRGEFALVEPIIVDIDGGKYKLDIRFRMLETHELAGAMGFNDDESDYVFTGNKTQQIKQIGNAVPVNTSSALVSSLFDY